MRAQNSSEKTTKPHNSNTAEKTNTECGGGTGYILGVVKEGSVAEAASPGDKGAEIRNSEACLLQSED